MRTRGDRLPSRVACRGRDAGHHRRGPHVARTQFAKWIGTRPRTHPGVKPVEQNVDVAARESSQLRPDTVWAPRTSSPASVSRAKASRAIVSRLGFR